MIDRINGQKYYEYGKINQQKRSSTDSSEFSMNMDKQGVVYEREEKEKEKKVQESEKELAGGASEGNSSARKGVMLEISSQGYQKAEKKQQMSVFADRIRELTDRIKEFAALAIDFMKSAWDKIWNDNTVTEEETAEEKEFPEVLAEEVKHAEGFDEESKELFQAQGIPNQALSAQKDYTQEEIRQLFRRGNQKEIEDFLSNHGERHLAKSTELLTQYDRRGSIVDVSHSDKELILHGNKNEIKL